MPKKEWLAAIENAVQLLAAAKDAPGWLLAAMNETIARAEALEPEARRDEHPSEFFYPH